ncbi:MAG TPA: prolyl oligopeptidase family serine peptidase [Ignavibacteria bacterium]|nr:prolyl oligopeptidase family serine peptidase [Ignavibacteria bacterium]
MKSFYLFILSLLFFSQAYSQEKIPLDHSLYNSWKRIERAKISQDGKFVTYEINPAKGDGYFYVYNSSSGKLDSLFRGSEGVVIPNTNIAVLKIKPPFDAIRKMKIDKKKSDEFPKDTLAYIDLSKGLKEINTIPDVQKFSYTEFGMPQLVYLKDYKSDTVAHSGKKKSKKIKTEHFKDTYQLNILDLKLQETDTVDDVSDFEISKMNDVVIYTKQTIDTAETHSTSIPYSEIFIYNPHNKTTKKIFDEAGKVSKLTISPDGSNAGFLYTSDTSSVKRYTLYFYNQNDKNAHHIADTNLYSLPKDWEISGHGSLKFSDDNSKLYFNTAPKTFAAPKDTIPDDEKFKVDVWNWQDPLLQSQQLKELDRALKRSYTSIFRIADKRFFQIADTLLNDVLFARNGNSDYALGLTNIPYRKYVTWDEPEYNDIYLVDMKTGNQKPIAAFKQYWSYLSPFNNYVIYYETSDSSWYSYSVKDEKYYNISKSIQYKIDDEEWDQPMYPSPYGIAGFTKNDEYILIYDRYDIWKVKPDNSSAPVCLTGGEGRKNNIAFRYSNLYPDSVYIGFNDKILIKGIDQNDFSESYYYISLDNPQTPEFITKFNYSTFTPVKAKSSDKFIFSKMSYTEYPDLWYSDLNFSNPKRISIANPQQSKYLWGSVEIFHWKDSAGTDMRGLLYRPENFDSTKKYPAIVYFYEKYTQDINVYYSVLPSRSVINFPMYNSNGYIVFIPDLTYKVGHPGQSAYNGIMSGTNALIETGFVDAGNIGLQGQSWGGYQSAYMVSRTGFFKAAMAGAPVVNMTSAYGGIRWESGMTRIMQYEKSQSRIGATLSDSLNLYIENSSLFNAGNITTPLLIMANDNDGAVPYQQGLEMFNSMRRLGKTVYLLNYNGDEHNLTKWPNRVDLSIRMLEFFDHYLKDKPMPDWMSNGIPAVRKGTTTGY